MIRTALGPALLLSVLLLSPAPANAQDHGDEVEDVNDEVPEPPPAETEVAPPRPATVTPPVTTDQAAEIDVARLDAWLGSFDGTARVLRYLAAPLGIVSGAALSGLGIWFVTDEEITIGSREASLGIGTAMIALGVMSVGIGIYNFAALTYPEDIYARFSIAREAGLSSRALGRFEGEFQALAEVSRVARSMSIVAGFALALGGGVAIAVAATEDRESPRTIGVATGAGLAIAGALLGALSFIPSPYERAWERYELGLGPDDPRPSVSVAPILSPQIAGVAVLVQR